jgi:hypothetical protein
MRLLQVAALASILLAAGCRGEDGLPPLEGGTELRLPTHPDWDEGPAALISGTVEFDEATGCLYLVSAEYRTLPVWPSGTRATRDPFRVVLADGREIREGDRIEAGGGGYAFDIDAMNHCLSDDVGRDMLNWDEDIVVRPSRE